MAKLIALCLAIVLCLFGAARAAPSFNFAHYPNILSGFHGHIYSYRPQVNQYGCTYWCRSQFTSQYYCCSSPQEEFLAGNRRVGGFNNFNNYNPYNPYLG